MKQKKALIKKISLNELRKIQVAIVLIFIELLIIKKVIAQILNEYTVEQGII